MWRAKELVGVDSETKAILWMLWFIWKTRNLKVFENKVITPDVTLSITLQEAETLRLANIRTTTINVVITP